MKIDKYEIAEKLGQGGMATVFLAYDKELERPVAIKTLRATDQQWPQASILEQEAKLMASLEHQNIARIYGWGTDPVHGLWMAMEHVQGVSLNLWKQEKKPGKQNILEVITQIGSALAFAHQKGVIHRDIKPNNIMIDTRFDQPTVKLLDFGIAKIYSKICGLPEQGQSAGSWTYMSPEQKADRPITVRSDVYMLARVFAELLTGEATPDIPTRRLGTAKFDLARLALPSTSDVQVVLSNALKVDPNLRTSDAKVLTESLVAALEPLNYIEGRFIFDAPKLIQPGKIIQLLQMADLGRALKSLGKPLCNLIGPPKRGSIHAIVICSNMVSQPNPESFENVKVELTGLVQILGSFVKLIPAPGPGDVNLLKTLESLGDRWENVCEKPPHEPPEKDMGFQRSLYRQKMNGFADAFEKMSGEKWDNDWKNQFFFFEVAAPEEILPGVVVVVINSVFLVHHYQPEHVEIDASIRINLHVILGQRYPHSKWIRVLVFHLTSSIKKAPSFNTGLEELFGEIDLVLHGGHRTQDGELFYFHYNTLVIPVPSMLSGQECDEQINYNLIKIDRSSAQLSISPIRGGSFSETVTLALKPEERRRGDGRKITVKYVAHDVQVLRTRYFPVVLDVIKKRKVCFVIGGLNSGRKTFLLQFEDHLKQLQNKCGHHILEFNPSIFHTYLDSLKRLIVDEELFMPQAELNSLFASLAWSAFQMLNPNGASFRKWPKKQITELTEKSFLLLYVTERELLAVEEPIECLKFFLNFLQQLNELALYQEGSQTMSRQLTVFMPFEEFGQLFRGNRDRVTKKLWRALCLFSKEFENPSTEIQQLTHDIGLLISLPCMTFGIDAAQGHFLKNSVLQIPSMNKEEVIELGTKVCSSELKDDIVETIIRHSGGLPWFVKLILICFESDHGDGELPASDRLKHSLDHAKAIVSLDFSGIMPNRGLDTLHNEVTQYYQILDENLKTANAFEDSGIFQAWKAGTRISSSDRLKNWITTGLAIPRNKHKKSDPIFIFDAYPHVWFTAAAPLPLLLFESWKKSRSSIGETEL